MISFDQSFELDDNLREQIKIYSESGDQFAESGKYQEAVDEYRKAFELVPEPKNDWEASTWIMAAISDACFKGGFFTSARESLDYAMTCPGAIGNPFLHLRRGQVLFEQEHFKSATDELMRAYMGGGSEIFEEDDKKYFKFLQSKVDLSSNPTASPRRPRS